MPITEEDLEVFAEEATIATALDRARRTSVEVELEIEHHGAFYAYVRDSRDRAVAAMVEMIGLDPATQANEIVRNQEIIKGWLHACDWVEQTLARGEEAEQEIRERYADGEEIEADAE